MKKLEIMENAVIKAIVDTLGIKYNTAFKFDKSWGTYQYNSETGKLETKDWPEDDWQTVTITGGVIEHLMKEESVTYVK